jgi:ribonuclease J
MKLIIHRGTREIGGTCVEVITENTRILLDFGMPLGDGQGGEFAEQMLEGKFIADLIEKKILYPIKGLYKDSVPQIDAILISHSHKDHYGFLKFAHPDIPVYMSDGAEKLINVLNIFVKKEGRLQLPKAAKIVRDRKSFDIGDLRITPYLVDHSAFDAMSFHVVDKTSGKSIFYTGDFRAAGW